MLTQADGLPSVGGGLAPLGHQRAFHASPKPTHPLLSRKERSAKRREVYNSVITEVGDLETRGIRKGFREILKYTRNNYYNMTKGKISNILLKLGRLLGQSKRKNKDIVEMWTDMVEGLGFKATDRMIELMVFDLQNNGVDLSRVRSVMENKEIDKAVTKFDEARTISEIIEKLSNELLVAKTEALSNIINLQNELAKVNQALLQKEMEAERYKQIAEELNQRLNSLSQKKVTTKKVGVAV